MTLQTIENRYEPTKELKQFVLDHDLVVKNDIGYVIDHDIIPEHMLKGERLPWTYRSYLKYKHYLQNHPGYHLVVMVLYWVSLLLLVCYNLTGSIRENPILTLGAVTGGMSIIAMVVDTLFTRWMFTAPSRYTFSRIRYEKLNIPETYLLTNIKLYREQHEEIDGVPKWKTYYYEPELVKLYRRFGDFENDYYLNVNFMRSITLYSKERDRKKTRDSVR